MASAVVALLADWLTIFPTTASDFTIVIPPNAVHIALSKELIPFSMFEDGAARSPPMVTDR